jgi:hypothetical protein
MFGKFFGTLAILGTIGLGGEASGSVIRTFASGVVSGNSTVDTYGLFGDAGANLAYLPMSYSIAYDDAQFGPPASCGTNCFYYDTVSGSSAKAVTISVTVNGKTVSYRAKVSGQVLFDEYGGVVHSYGAAADADIVTGVGTGMALVTIYRKPTSFGVKPKGLQSDDEDDYAAFYPYKHKKAEVLNFDLLSAKKN